MISMSKEIENNSLKVPQENNNPESNVVNQMNNPELNHDKNDLSLKDNSKNNDLEAAFGYRVNRYVSLELYYENKQKERFSLRALGNL